VKRRDVPPACEEFGLRIAEALGEPSPERRRAEEHAARCSRCAEILADTRSLLGELRSAKVPDPGPLYWRSLPDRIGAASKAHTRRTAWRAAGLAAALLLAAGLLPLTVGPGHVEHREEPALVEAGFFNENDLDEAMDDEFLSSLASLAPEIGTARIWEYGEEEESSLPAERAEPSGPAEYEPLPEGVAFPSWHDEDELLDLALESLTNDEAGSLVEMLREEIESRRS
jgi:hypothetical protein